MDLKTIIQVIKDPLNKTLNLLTRSGYRGINSICYQISDVKKKPDWKNFYLCDPHNFEGTCQQKKLIIGGEACIWSNYMDANNFISRSWARAIFVAERLWSDKSIQINKSTIPRFERQRCKMIESGLTIEPIVGPGYCEYDHI